jgi:hypothetical protein
MTPTRSFTIRRRDGSEHLVLVDASDFDLVMAAGPWFIHKPPASRTAYVRRNVYVGGKQIRTETLHRFLVPGAEEVDHRNENGLDNRKENLRPATRSQNQHNRSCYRSSRSGVKGVYWHKAAGKWAAQISLDGRQRGLGLFVEIEDAKSAYASAAAELHGDFANTKAGS